MRQMGIAASKERMRYRVFECALLGKRWNDDVIVCAHNFLIVYAHNAQITMKTRDREPRRMQCGQLEAVGEGEVNDGSPQRCEDCSRRQLQRRRAVRPK